MNKHLLRIVTLLLVPCLMVDPATAMGVGTALSLPAKPVSQHLNTPIMDEQALTLACVLMLHPVVPLTAIRASLSHIAHQRHAVSASLATAPSTIPSRALTLQLMLLTVGLVIAGVFSSLAGGPDPTLYRYNPAIHKPPKPQDIYALKTELERHQRVLEALANRPEDVPFAYKRIGDAMPRRRYNVRVSGKQNITLERGQVLTLEGNGLQFSISGVAEDPFGIQLTLQEMTGLQEDFPEKGELVLGTLSSSIKPQQAVLNRVIRNLTDTLIKTKHTTGYPVLDRLFGLVPLSASDPQKQAEMTFVDQEIAKDPSQARAVRMAMDPTEVQFIDGPAATGKTAVITEIIRQAVKQGKRVLLVSHDHQAVDNALKAIMDELPVLRLGNNPQFNYGTKKVWAGNKDDGLNNTAIQTFRARKKQQGGYVLAATDQGLTTDWAIQQPGLNELIREYRQGGVVENNIDLLIMDEASRETLTGAMVPLTYLQKSGKVIFVGDHAQLPPFGLKDGEERYLKKKKIDEASVNAYNVSIWDWLLNRGYGDWSRLLINYRSHPLLVNMLSHLFYQDVVTPFKTDIQQRETLQVIDLAKVTPELPLKLENDLGKKDEKDEVITSYLNTYSAKYVLALVKYYHDEMHLSFDQITILTPYKLQMEILGQLLSKEYPNEKTLPMVTTIDKFQGGENKAVILDFVRSNKEQKIGFIKDLRRLNVALSRAEDYLSIVWDSRTLVGNGNASDNEDDSKAREVFRYIQSYFNREVLIERFPYSLQGSLNVDLSLPLAPAKTPASPPRKELPPPSPAKPVESVPPPPSSSPESQLVNILIGQEHLADHMGTQVWAPLINTKTLQNFDEELRRRELPGGDRIPDASQRAYAIWAELADLFERNNRSEEDLVRSLAKHLPSQSDQRTKDLENLRGVLHIWCVHFGQAEKHLKDLLRETFQGHEWPAQTGHFEYARDVYYAFHSSEIRRMIRQDFEALTRRFLEENKNEEAEILNSLALPDIQDAVNYMSQAQGREIPEADRFQILSPSSILAQIKAPPVVSGITLRPSTVVQGETYSAAITGTNLRSASYYDVTMQYPDGTTTEIPNWQRGDSQMHSVPDNAPIGTWIIISVRAHHDMEDHQGASNQVKFELTINPKTSDTKASTVATSVPVVRSPLKIDGNVGEHLSYQIKTEPEAAECTVEKLPPGLTFDLETRRIFGTPMETGTSRVAIRIKNSAGVGEASLVVKVIDPAQEEQFARLLQVIAEDLTRLLNDEVTREFKKNNSPRTQVLRRYLKASFGEFPDGSFSLIGGDLVTRANAICKEAKCIGFGASQAPLKRDDILNLVYKINDLKKHTEDYAILMARLPAKHDSVHQSLFIGAMLKKLGVPQNAEIKSQRENYPPVYSPEAIATATLFSSSLDTIVRDIDRFAMAAGVLSKEQFVEMYPGMIIIRWDDTKVSLEAIKHSAKELHHDLTLLIDAVRASSSTRLKSLEPKYQEVQVHLERILKEWNGKDPDFLRREFDPWIDKFGSYVKMERLLELPGEKSGRQRDNTPIHQQISDHVASLFVALGYTALGKSEVDGLFFSRDPSYQNPLGMVQGGEAASIYNRWAEVRKFAERELKKEREQPKPLPDLIQTLEGLFITAEEHMLFAVKELAKEEDLGLLGALPFFLVRALIPQELKLNPGIYTKEWLQERQDAAWMQFLWRHAKKADGSPGQVLVNREWVNYDKDTHEPRFRELFDEAVNRLRSNALVSLYLHPQFIGLLHLIAAKKKIASGKPGNDVDILLDDALSESIETLIRQISEEVTEKIRPIVREFFGERNRVHYLKKDGEPLGMVANAPAAGAWWGNPTYIKYFAWLETPLVLVVGSAIAALGIGLLHLNTWHNLWGLWGISIIAEIIVSTFSYYVFRLPHLFRGRDLYDHPDLHRLAFWHAMAGAPLGCLVVLHGHWPLFTLIFGAFCLLIVALVSRLHYQNNQLWPFSARRPSPTVRSGTTGSNENPITFIYYSHHVPEDFEVIRPVLDEVFKTVDPLHTTVFMEDNVVDLDDIYDILSRVNASDEISYQNKYGLSSREFESLIRLKRYLLSFPKENFVAKLLEAARNYLEDDAIGALDAIHVIDTQRQLNEFRGHPERLETDEPVPDPFSPNVAHYLELVSYLAASGVEIRAEDPPYRAIGNELDRYRAHYFADQALLQGDLTKYFKFKSSEIHSAARNVRKRDEQTVREIAELRLRDPKRTIIVIRGNVHSDLHQLSRIRGEAVEVHNLASNWLQWTSPENQIIYQRAANFKIEATSDQLKKDLLWTVLEETFYDMFPGVSFYVYARLATTTVEGIPLDKEMPDPSLILSPEELDGMIDVIQKAIARGESYADVGNEVINELLKLGKLDYGIQVAMVKAFRDGLDPVNAIGQELITQWTAFEQEKIPHGSISTKPPAPEWQGNMGEGISISMLGAGFAQDNPVLTAMSVLLSIVLIISKASLPTSLISAASLILIALFSKPLASRLTKSYHRHFLAAA